MLFKSSKIFFLAMTLVGEGRGFLNRVVMSPVSAVLFLVLLTFICHVVFQTVDPFVYIKGVIVDELKGSVNGTIEFSLLTTMNRVLTSAISNEPRVLAVMFCLFPLLMCCCWDTVVLVVILLLFVFAIKGLTLSMVVVYGSFMMLYVIAETPSSKTIIMVVFVFFLVLYYRTDSGDAVYVAPVKGRTGNSTSNAVV